MTLFSRRSFALGLLSLCLLAGTSALPGRAASTFNSGSTGADGAFAPTANVTLQIPDSGVFNFTTVNIPSGVAVTFTRNAANTPVTILASGDVNISGYIDVSGSDGSNTVNGTNTNVGSFRSTGGAGGSGGFDGGGGGGYVAPFTGAAGDGPGGGGGGIGDGSYNNLSGGGGAGYSSAGGAASGRVNGSVTSSAANGGLAYGTSILLPLIGGSGGGGGVSLSQNSAGSGGGGGGAILIASSGTITVPGAIYAFGGNGGHGWDGGGGGSGGAVRLVATTLAGNAAVNVAGGQAGYAVPYYAYYGGAGAPGYVRLEAYNFNNFNPTIVGGQGVATTAGPGPVTLANPPQLQIVSVAGINAPAAPRGSLAAPPDIILQNTVANPVTVAITARNIPLATVVTLSLIPQTGAETSVPSNALAGTDAASTTTASVSLPDGKCVLYASATVDLTGTPVAMRMKMDGEPVDKILVASVYGGPSQLTYVLHSGRKIVIGKLALGVKGAKTSRN